MLVPKGYKPISAEEEAYYKALIIKADEAASLAQAEARLNPKDSINSKLIPPGATEPAFKPTPKPQPQQAADLQNPEVFAKVAENLQGAKPTMEPIMYESPAHMLMAIKPNPLPHKWQVEEMETVAGNLPSGFVDFTDEAPYRRLIVAANGSGKDKFLIAATAVWFILRYPKSRVIITTGSHDQMKAQTEPHITELINLHNEKFGKLIHSIQFHHICPALGSEIKLFVTDEAGRAEGFHPWDDGKMLIIINEAKTVSDDIWTAANRCSGYSHMMLVSSPGQKHGFFYRTATSERTVFHPSPVQPDVWALRKISAFDCPHIKKSHINNIANEFGIESEEYLSIILAEFTDLGEPVVISVESYNKCEKAGIEKAIVAHGSDIGIGLDLAGGGDENACWVRMGNRVIDKFFFRQTDTDVASDLIDLHLDPYRDLPYIFNADNGGLGQAIIDKLVKLGWRIRRRNNQSPAFNKRLYLNLGAELYYRVRRMIHRLQIILPTDVPLFKTQLTSRHIDGLDSTQGKIKLESKKAARAAGRPSPDRADAFVLCFYDYVPPKPVQDNRVLLTMDQLKQVTRFDFSPKMPPMPPGLNRPAFFTLKTHDI